MAVYLNRDVDDSGEFCFLSYKSENCEILRKIVPNLAFNVWYDYGIKLMQDWKKEIEDHIKRSQMVVLFLSRDAIREGSDSFVLSEFRTALRYEKQILVVYLEEVPFSAWPEGTAFECDKIESRQCIMPHYYSSPEELIQQINNSANCPPTGSKKQDVPIRKGELTMRVVSNYGDDTSIYCGNGDLHYSHKWRKICMYNTASGYYEIRHLDELDYVITFFRQSSDALKNSRIFYSLQGEYLFFFLSGMIHTYDMRRGKWTTGHGAKLPLEKGEIPDWEIDTDAGAAIFLVTQKNDKIHRVFQVDLARGKPERILKLESFDLQRVLHNFKNQSGNWVLFSDGNNRLVCLDLVNNNLFTPDREWLNQQFILEDPRLSDINGELSNDGSLFSCSFTKGFRVFETDTGRKVTEEYYGTFRNVYLLKNQTVLKYDNQGNVLKISAAGRMTVIPREFFLECPEFCGEIPHTMLYDETEGNFIFVMGTEINQIPVQRIVVLNGQKKVTLVSKNIVIPFEQFYCRCNTCGEDLIVFFTSPDKVYKKYQQTFIFAGKYRS